MKKVIVELTETYTGTLNNLIQLSSACGMYGLEREAIELLRRLSQGVYCDIETPVAPVATVPTVKRRIKTLPLTKE